MTTQITDHATQAKARLLSQYKKAANLKIAMDALFGDQIQSIEDATYTVFNKWDINAATEVLLDDIGDLVGEKRQGATDALYRVFIKARIGANTSEGDRERIIQIWKLMVPGAKVTVFETYPAGMDIYTDTPLDPALVATAFTLIQEVAAGGVRIGFTAVYDTTEAFGFEDSGVGVGGFSSLVTQGQNTSVTANELVVAGETFITKGVTTSMLVWNVTTGVSSTIVSIPTETRIVLTDDIFPAAPVYYDVNENVGGKLSYIQGS